jgi:hypothetical protein
LRAIRNDPLGRLHSHRQIDQAQYQRGRAFQNDWEKAERVQKREPTTEGQRKAALRLGRAERELCADGAAVLIMGLSIEQVGQRRNL